MVDRTDSTLDPSLAGQHFDRPKIAGLVHVFSTGTPTCKVRRFAMPELELGRSPETLGPLVDPRVSRTHARVRRSGTRFMVTDLHSQNGTWVDGERLPSGGSREVSRVLRVGDSLFVPSNDVELLERLGVAISGGFVRGPSMQEILGQIARSARLGPNLHIHGESGTGKEGVARAFHAATGPGSRPFVAVNCAAIPETLAERLLFGSKKGAYSGADADAPGYFQSADGGTLFLDEIVELDLAVQAKLLRAIEAREVVPLGATAPKKIDVRVCSATHKDLRALVAAGKLREDLFFRIGRPEARLPPLRQRPEEIPYLLDSVVRQTNPVAIHVSFVEACLIKPWPGNVRELLTEARAAIEKALLAGAQRVEATDLAPGAGSAFGTPPDDPTPPAAVETRPTKPLDPASHARIVDALQQHGGNVTAAARTLGLHRTQLRRLLARHNIAVPEEDVED